MGTTQETIPADIPYLRVDPVRVAAWQKHYEAQGRTGRRRVGVVFQANLAGRSAPKKSMRIGDMVPLAAIEGIDLVNLQHGPEGRAFAAAVPAVIDATAEPMPLDEYAAAIAATDILISVDTMVAHGAGAMGRPVWVALPMAPGWHWGLGRAACPWYPSANLFRQTSDYGWEDVIAELCRRMSTLLSLKTSDPAPKRAAQTRPLQLDAMRAVDGVADR